MELREFLDTVWGLITTAPKDTTPERIGANRRLFKPLFAQRQELKKQAQVLGILPEAKVLADLLEEWMRYFDTSYRAQHSIDELPQLIEDAILDIYSKLNIY